MKCDVKLKQTSFRRIYSVSLNNTFVIKTIVFQINYKLAILNEHILLKLNFYSLEVGGRCPLWVLLTRLANIFPQVDDRMIDHVAHVQK